MKIPSWLATAAWLAAWAAATAGSLSLVQPSRAPIDYDEVYWIGSTYYYHLAFHERDWSHPDWKVVSARENPQIARYVIGARLALAGQQVVNRDMIACFRLMFPVPAEKFNAWEGRDLILEDIGKVTLAQCGGALGGPGVTRKDDLFALARQAVVACGIVASLVTFFFGASIASRATGLIASQLLLLHPVNIRAYTHAMSDGVAMLFSVAAAYGAWDFHRRLSDATPISRRRAMFLVFLNGTLLALAVGAKMNALLIVALFGAGALAAAVLAWRRGDPSRVRLTLGLAAGTGVVALVLFSLSNPAIMIDPIAGLPALFTIQSMGMRYFQDLMADRALLTLPAKFRAVSNVAFGVLGFALVSVWSLLAAVRRPRHGVWFVAGWFLITVVVVTLWIPFAWQRYVLPVAPSMLLLLAYAITSSSAMVIEGVRARLTPRRSP